MALLALDIGNSKGKAGIFDLQYNLLEVVFTTENITSEVKYLHKKYHFQDSIISSVAQTPTELASFLSNETHLHQVMSQNDGSLPITIDYLSPQTLGIDRLAAAIGAQTYFPNQNSIVIDSGTCITYDIITNGKYLGGAISPGINMRFKAMNHFTARLPLVEKNVNLENTYGYDTMSSMQIGIGVGVWGECLAFIKRYEANYQNLNIILTGGDGSFFEQHLKNSIFAKKTIHIPHLVLEGLISIIRHRKEIIK